MSEKLGSSQTSALPDNVRDSVTSAARIDALKALQALDTAPDNDFDRLTRLAASIFGAPIALITLIDVDRQWFKAHFGTAETENATDKSFCAHTIADQNPYMVVKDASADARFANNPSVAGAPHIKFYAGVPVVVHAQRVGTLCVLSDKPGHNVDDTQLAQLVDLAEVASSLFALKDEARVRARIAADLIKEEWRHALTLEAGKVGSWVWDLRTGEVVANDIFKRMFDLPLTGKVLYETVYNNILADDRPGLDAALNETFEKGLDFESDFRVSSSARWLTGRGRVYQRDAAGKPLLVMGVYLDITEARQSADNTRLLLRELNHRVKNTLAMIQSLARQSMRQNPDPQRFMDTFSGRLRTLSEAHALLADRDWSGIGLSETIKAQVAAMVPFHIEQLEVNGRDMHLPPDHALGLGLVLHELTSNAVRYGALSVPKGKVSIAWTETSEPVAGLEMIWKERDGPKIAPPEETGLGTKLIQRSLDKVLDSKVTLSFPPDGVEARIFLPLKDVV